MDEDGSNIRLIYIEDEQLLVFPQIAKNECAPYANVPHSPLESYARISHCKFQSIWIKAVPWVQSQTLQKMRPDMTSRGLIKAAGQ